MTIINNTNIVNIKNELKNSYLNYAISVIVDRALPDVRDGLKPVHRRILFAMYIINNVWNKAYKKSARIVGDVIGKYHPHGDIAVYDSIVRLAQTFSLRYVLIDGQGNFGSIDGDSAAAMRYTEIRMSKISNELLCDINKNTVDYISNYDNTEKLPIIFPTKIPNLLINGSSGIAVGMATNIPPHNISEIIDGCIAYINNNNITIEELMKYIPGPDFPTSALINGNNGIIDAYKTGKGKIYIRAKSKIELNTKTNKETIIINEIPYQVNKSTLLKKIYTLIKNKKIDGINNIRDESDKDGLRIVIEIKKDFVANIILNNLYSLTKLQISYGINMVALHNNQPKLFNLKDMISAFINHRKEIIIRKNIYDMNKNKEKIHLIEGYLIALLNINKIINIIKNNKNSKKIKYLLIKSTWNICDINLFNLFNNSFDLTTPSNLKNIKRKKKKLLQKKYFFTNNQINGILNLKLYKLTLLEQNKLLNNYKKLLNDIKNINLTLNNSNILIKIINNELNYIKLKYGDKRKTEIISNALNIKTLDLINKESVIITISHMGYIKCQLLSLYNAQHRGGKGKLLTSIKYSDYIKKMLITKTHNIILLFSNIGRIYYMNVYDLNISHNKLSKGLPIVNKISNLYLNENITSFLSICNDLNNNKNEHYIFISTIKGIVKKTNFNNFNKLRNSGIFAINLNKNDKIASVGISYGHNDIIIFSSHGKVVRFTENSVKPMKRFSKGVKGINLINNDKVVSTIIFYNYNYFLTVTKKGYGKCTNQNKYLNKSRGINGVISMKLNNLDEVVDAIQVNKNDQVAIITSSGNLSRIKISEIRKVSRNSKGVLLIKISNNESVVGIQRIV